MPRNRHTDRTPRCFRPGCCCTSRCHRRSRSCHRRCRSRRCWHRNPKRTGRRPCIQRPTPSWPRTPFRCNSPRPRKPRLRCSWWDTRRCCLRTRRGRRSASRGCLRPGRRRSPTNRYRSCHRTSRSKSHPRRCRKRIGWWPCTVGRSPRAWCTSRPCSSRWRCSRGRSRTCRGIVDRCHCIRTDCSCDPRCLAGPQNRPPGWPRRCKLRSRRRKRHRSTPHLRRSWRRSRRGARRAGRRPSFRRTHCRCTSRLEHNLRRWHNGWGTPAMCRRTGTVHRTD